MQDQLTPDEVEFEAAFANAAAGRVPAAEGAAESQSDIVADQPEATASVAADQPQAGAVNAPASPGPTVEQLQRELDDARHRERSSANRISAFARQADEARRESEELRRNAQAGKPATQQKAPQPEDESDDVLTQAPELQAAVQKRLSKAMEPMQAALDAANARLQELGEVAQTAARQVEPLVSRETEREKQLVERRLDEAFGAWRDTVRSGDFKSWLNRQPDTVQTLFQNGSTFDEAAVVLKLFNTDKPAQAAAAPAAARPPAGTSNASQTERLRQAVGVRSTTAPRPAAKAEDFEGAFAEFAALRAKRA